MPFLLKYFRQIRNEQSQYFALVQHLLLLYAKLRKHELFFGSALSVAIALLVCPLVRGKPVEPEVPIFFLVVLTAIAWRFGSGAGSLSTILSTIIFAEFLFEPLRSLVVKNPVEKINLAWMIIGGLAISNFFGRSTQAVERGDTNRDDDVIA